MQFLYHFLRASQDFYKWHTNNLLHKTNFPHSLGKLLYEIIDCKSIIVSINKQYLRFLLLRLKIRKILIDHEYKISFLNLFCERNTLILNERNVPVKYGKIFLKHPSKETYFLKLIEN